MACAFVIGCFEGRSGDSKRNQEVASIGRQTSSDARHSRPESELAGIATCPTAPAASEETAKRADDEAEEKRDEGGEGGCAQQPRALCGLLT